MRPVEPRYYYRQFLHPRYWGAWCLIGLLRLIAFMPHSVIQGLGHLIGVLSYWFARERRQAVETNIELCFPEKTPEEQRRLVRASMVAVAKGYVESARGWWGNMEPYHRNLEVHGLEHFEEAKRRGKGIILLGGHFSILDFAGPLLMPLMDFNYMYRPHGNPLFNSVIERARRRFSERAFAKDELKGMIRFIRQGGLVWYGCDQDFGRRNSVFAPFFGVEAATLTAPAWIAKATGATVLMIGQFREKGKTYSIHFSPIFEDYPSGDQRADAARMNEELERMIRLHPDQYLWAHRRFKTRPEGEPPVYPPKKKKLRKQRQKEKAAARER